MLFAGGLIAAAVAVLLSVLQRRDEAPVVGGNFAVCAQLEGDAARACYRREVGRELASVGSGVEATVSLEAPTGAPAVTFASSEAEARPLLCDLHTRVGVIDEQVPSWLGWTEPLAATS